VSRFESLAHFRVGPACERVDRRRDGIIPAALDASDVRPARLTGAETLAASALALFAAPIIAAYLLDRVGLAFVPTALLPVALGASLLVFWRLRPRVIWRVDELASYATIVLGTFAALVWWARPWLLPIGSGPDLTHHLLLIDYLERHWRLVHDPSVEQYLGEMVRYTPGVHVLAALSGAWFRSDGLHTIHAVVSATVALKAGVVYLIALRILPRDAWRVVVAAFAPILLLLPHAYVLDSFVRDSFFAQVVSEYFAVAMWWALTIWDEDPHSGLPAVALFAGAGAAGFLTWPVWLGPLGVAFGLALLCRRDTATSLRVGHALIAGTPIAVVAALHVLSHASGLQMARADGYVITPSIGLFTPWLVALAGAGAVVAGVTGPARITLFLTVGTALQSGVLYLQSRADGNASAYMAFKTFYLFPYPLATLAVLPVGMLVRRVATAVGRERRSAWLQTLWVWGVVGAATALALIPVATVKRDPPTLSEPMLQAGLWARDHLPGGCFAYLVPDDETAYWLHLAVLHNKRISGRTSNNDTFNLRATVLAWLTPGGLPYAIADLPALTRDVRDELDILQQFDSVAVVRRRSAGICDDGQTAAP
jgi:hypothetical protein